MNTTIHKMQSGHARGEDHHRAKLSDEEVRKMREAHIPHVVGYEQLAQMFKCGISTARDICTYRTRKNVT